MKSRSIRSTT